MASIGISPTLRREPYGGKAQTYFGTYNLLIKQEPGLCPLDFSPSRDPLLIPAGLGLQRVIIPTRPYHDNKKTT